MRLRLEEPALVDDLIVFLDRCNCEVRRVADGIVDVTPAQPDVERVFSGRARLELEGYLRVWDALHATATTLVDDPAAKVA